MADEGATVQWAAARLTKLRGDRGTEECHTLTGEFGEKTHTLKALTQPLTRASHGGGGSQFVRP